jgi:hypothetical protein
MSMSMVTSLEEPTWASGAIEVLAKSLSSDASPEHVPEIQITHATQVTTSSYSRSYSNTHQYAQ